MQIRSRVDDAQPSRSHSRRASRRLVDWTLSLAFAGLLGTVVWKLDTPEPAPTHRARLEARAAVAAGRPSFGAFLDALLRDWRDVRITVAGQVSPEGWVLGVGEAHDRLASPPLPDPASASSVVAPRSAR